MDIFVETHHTYGSTCHVLVIHIWMMGHHPKAKLSAQCLCRLHLEPCTLDSCVGPSCPVGRSDENMNAFLNREYDLMCVGRDFLQWKLIASCNHNTNHNSLNPTGILSCRSCVGT